MEYTCTDCTLTFSKHSNLRTHLKKFHPDRLDVIAPNKTFKCVATCDKCWKRFSKYSNFKRHATKFHPESVNELTYKVYPYQCSECQKNFLHLHNLRSHQKTHEKDITDREKKKRLLKCNLCDYTNALKSSLILHFEEYHNIKIEQQNLHFPSVLEFQQWKTEWEKTNYSSYVKYSHPYTTTEGTKKTTYICHRSGFYEKNCQDNRRRLKKQGSKKINGICPSQMKVTILLENGSVKVNFIPTHIGHDNDLAHLNLTDNEKMEIASKIASKIPLASILDDVRDSVTNNRLERVHLLTRKDLHNITQSFNLNADTKNRSEDEGHNILISDETSIKRATEQDTLLEVLIKSNMDPGRTTKQLEIEKRKLILLQTQMIQNISSFEQLEAFKNIIAPLEPTLRGQGQGDSFIMGNAIFLDTAEGKVAL